jgi:prepilin-type N-terminal cleavage/methylation domain-containing protein
MPAARQAFTLTELLVVISIMLVLMALVGAAVSGARTSAKINATRATIDKLNTILMTQLATYDSKSVDPSLLPSGITSKSAARAWYIRRNMITGDMPDRWSDVAYMAANPGGFKTSSQMAYIGIWNGMGTAPTVQYEGAECLFMIVMRGGIADCLDCGALRTAQIGDKDTDGMPEFLDEWGQPIDYILWCPAIDLPAGTGNPFFSGNRAPDNPFPSSGSPPAPALRLRPLIYSAGIDGQYSVERKPGQSTLDAGTNPVGRDCGNWGVDPTLSCGLTSAGAADNITNLDAEAKQTP